MKSITEEEWEDLLPKRASTANVVGPLAQLGFENSRQGPLTEFDVTDKGCDVTSSIFAMGLVSSSK
jgi:hypothetical protein